jgi:hypothetical protein
MWALLDSLGYSYEFEILCRKNGSCGLGHCLGPKSRDIGPKSFFYGPCIMHKVLKNKKGSIKGNICTHEWYMGIN